MAAGESAGNGRPPAISIVICTYDRPDALVRCLESLRLQQVGHPFEIVVVDNHPQSAKTVSLYTAYPAVRWLQQPVAGLSRARNTGIRAALGEVIVTTDDDIVAPPDWLHLLTAPLFAGDPTLVATTGDCFALKVTTEAERLFEAYGGLRHGDTPAIFDKHFMRRSKISFPQLWRIGATANAAFRASLFQPDSTVGLFEERLGAGTPPGAWEDIYAFWRILSAGYRIAYVPAARLGHAHRETMPALQRQLEAYRRGEIAFLLMMLLRHGEVRALGQMFWWIPKWRFALLVQETARRLRGQRKFSFRMFWPETLAYFAGPWALWQSWRR
jgi:GT2 family glycosyltransferase